MLIIYFIKVTIVIIKYMLKYVLTELSFGVFILNPKQMYISYIL